MRDLSVKLNMVLAIAVAILGWKVLMGDVPRQPPAIASSAAASTPVQPPRSAVAGHAGAMDARLATIDARLAAIERALATASVAAPNARTAATTAAPIDAQTAAAADRRVAAMFPQGRFDHADLIRFRAALGELPADQQAALAAAFSRAVNGDRLQSRM
jgi:hypothetical protein